MREVNKQRVPAFGRINHKIYTVGLEKIVPPVTSVSDVAATSISNVPRDERILRAGDARFKARLISLGWKQRYGTDRAIVAAKDKFGRSRNSALL